jgi:adenylate cyclase
MRAELRSRLVALGASDDDIDRAEAEGWVPLLAFERLLLPGERRYDLPALVAAAGIDESLARGLWRAVGFPDVPSGLAVFTDRDVEAARLAFAQASPREIRNGTLLQQVRVIGGALSRVASVGAAAFTDQLDDARRIGLSDEDIALAILDDTRFAEIGQLIDYVHRLQLRAAVWRRAVLDAEPGTAVAVGFADLAGYTALSTTLDSMQISDLVGRWEAVAYDAVATNGARVVKTIGDEVMYVGLAYEALNASLALHRAAADAELPALRIGLAAGPVINRDGDYFGPVVNLASRLTELAEPGEVLVPASLHDELTPPAADEFRWVSKGVRTVRSIGPVEVFALERNG